MRAIHVDHKNSPTRLHSTPSVRLGKIAVPPGKKLRDSSLDLFEAPVTPLCYFGVSLRFASSCTDFVVADLSIVDLVGRPHAAGGFVICLTNTR
jgi:hypothetical protein